MSVRLYPDIIVATEIDSTLLWDNDPNDVVIYIGNCLAHQSKYVTFGIRNGFIGYDGNEWTRDDYERYLQSLPLFFKKISETAYQVNMKELEREDVKNLNETEYTKLDLTQRYSYGKLLTQGTYNRHVLTTLGINL